MEKKIHIPIGFRFEFFFGWQEGEEVELAFEDTAQFENNRLY